MAHLRDNVKASVVVVNAASVLLGSTVRKTLHLALCINITIVLLLL